MRPLLVLIAACLVLSLPARDAYAQETPSPSPVPVATAVAATEAVSAEEVLARADEISADADRAMTTVNLMLGFLQGAGLILGVLLAAAAVVGLRSSTSLRAEMREELEKATERFEKMLAESQSRLTDSQARLVAFEKEAEDELGRMREYGETATSSLSASQQRVENAVNALTLVQLGKLQIENRNWVSAQRTIQAAYNADPTNRAAAYYLGELHIINRDLDKAIELLKIAQPDGEVFPPAEAALAFALRLQGERFDDLNMRNHYYADAERRYLRALDIERAVRDIHDQSVWAGLGALYRRQRRYDDAYRCYDQAEKVTPYNSYPLINLAILLLHRGETGKAQEHFRTVVTISERRLESNPMDEWTRYDAITGNLGMGNAERARMHLNHILSRSPSRGPMESFISGLRFMIESKHAPAEAIDLLTEVEARLAELSAAEVAEN